MSLKERHALIERDSSDLPLSLQAQLLSLSRASLYYHPRPPSSREVAIKHRIDELYTAYPFYGSRRLQAVLQPEFGTLARNTVRQYMRDMGISAMYPGPNLSRRQHNQQCYPSLLRHRAITAPNQVWAIDITYVRLRSSWMYLVAVIDWYSRSMLSWALDDTLEIGFVLQTVDRALAVATPQIWNSDQGSHFTSPLYTQRLEAAGVQVSMDGRGRALDNIAIERFWRSYKYEEVYLYAYASPREARHGAARSMPFYNHERPHQALAYRTPAALYFAPSLRRGQFRQWPVMNCPQQAMCLSGPAAVHTHGRCAAVDNSQRTLERDNLAQACIHCQRFFRANGILIYEYLTKSVS